MNDKFVLAALEDKLGGIATVNINILNYLSSRSYQCSAVISQAREDRDATLFNDFSGLDIINFKYSKRQNIYSVVNNYHRAIPRGQGVFISNSALELACFSQFYQNRTIFQIVHDDYNFRLSRIYEPVIDVMIAHSRFFYEALLNEFPLRADSIFYRPYGITLSPKVRTFQDGPLRLVFLGRLHPMKGIYDLPKIDQLLIAKGLRVAWMIIGAGPEKNLLQSVFPPSDRVTYRSPLAHSDVLDLCSSGDIFVFPSRFEGFPVALLEAMSAGLVPVVSDLPSGIPEVVLPSTGIRVPIGNCEAFADAIFSIASNPLMLEAMSKNARQQAESFSSSNCLAGYIDLFGNWNQLKRPWTGPLKIKLGSRLDQPWLPNLITQSIRRCKSICRY